MAILAPPAPRFRTTAVPKQPSIKLLAYEKTSAVGALPPALSDRIRFRQRETPQSSRKDNSEDGSIDEETAVDIAMAIIKNKVPSYFQKPTSYSLSYSSDDDAYFISISQDHENVNLIDDRQVNLVISKKDGAFLAIWGIF